MSYDLLEGVRVVELSMYAFAPSTAAVLAEWGADVIKVVPPKVADPMMGTPIAGEAAADPQVVANDLVARVEGRFPLVRTPAQFDEVRPELRPAPHHGQQTEEVLLQLGRTWEEILELKARDAVL